MKSNLKIEEGDRVKVDFTRLDSVTQPYFYGKVLGIPRDVGDSWRFLEESSQQIIYVNPNCSRLETIILMETS